MNAYKYATGIITKLVRTGFCAYFAGGWVRDYVMGHPSEDIDIATNATPSEIMDLFPHTLLVGLAFGVVIVVIEGHQFEVATFRKDLHYIDGRRPEEIDLTATAQEDALRRDFTINGMFYDPLTEVIHDYVQGKHDIQHGVIRTIGNPHERFFEDRLRMLRAFRFAARFSFNMDVETQQAIQENADKLFPAVAMERVWQEFNKMAAYPRFDQAIVEMHRLSLLDVIFPEMEGMHIKDLRHLVSAYAAFPPACPTILYIMEIFPHLPLKQKLEIGKRMRAKNSDLKLIEYFDALSQTLQEKEGMSERQTLVHLMAHPHYTLCLHVLAARYPLPHERAAFLNKYEQLFQQLESHIKRVQTKSPLITSNLLQQQGILPGKQMGLLLKEAEKLAINENLEQTEWVLAKLKQSPYWKVA